MTSISHAFSDGPSEEIETLKPLVEYAFNRIKNEVSDEINAILSKAIKSGFNIQVDQRKKGKKSQFMVDVTALNLIYYKMKSSESSKETKEFFTALWNELKNYKKEIRTNAEYGKKYSNAPNHEIPHLKVFKTNPDYTAISFRKFYQMKFLELVLSVESLDGLITKYAQFKQDFSGVLIDFRYRLLNIDDFSRLNQIIPMIRDLLAKAIIKKEQENDLRLFICELFQFINFKFLINLSNLIDLSNNEPTEMIAVENSEVPRFNWDLSVSTDINDQEEQICGWFIEMQNNMREIRNLPNLEELKLPSPDLLYSSVNGSDEGAIDINQFLHYFYLKLSNSDLFCLILKYFERYGPVSYSFSI